jgi:hypothetical protein
MINLNPEVVPTEDNFDSEAVTPPPTRSRSGGMSETIRPPAGDHVSKLNLSKKITIQPESAAEVEQCICNVLYTDPKRTISDHSRHACLVGLLNPQDNPPRPTTPHPTQIN